MSHEIQKQVDEMEKEWKDYKSKSMWALLTFIGSILTIGIWVGTMQTNIDSMLGHEDKDSERFIQIESRINNLEVTSSEIRTRLTSIDLTLQEIKAAINKIQ